jgi:hypothetical protein
MHAACIMHRVSHTHHGARVHHMGHAGCAASPPNDLRRVSWLQEDEEALDDVEEALEGAEELLEEGAEDGEVSLPL